MTHKKGETMWINARAGWEDWCTSIDKPAPTVRARHTHAWVTLKDGKATHHCRMSAQDLAALQTFPPDYQLPERKQEACLQVGNAVPPRFAQAIVEGILAGAGQAWVPRSTPRSMRSRAIQSVGR